MFGNGVKIFQYCFYYIFTTENQCIEASHVHVALLKRRKFRQIAQSKQHVLPGSPSKNDVDEFLDRIHSYKKENKVVNRKWLNDLINKYNANFSEDFSQYLSLSKDIILP